MTATGIGANHSGAESTLDHPQELKASREQRESADTRDRDAAVFEWLPEGLEEGGNSGSSSMRRTPRCARVRECPLGESTNQLARPIGELGVTCGDARQCLSEDLLLTRRRIDHADELRVHPLTGLWVHKRVVE